MNERTCHTCHWWIERSRMPDELAVLFSGHEALGACLRSIEGHVESNAGSMHAIVLTAHDNVAVLATGAAFTCAGWTLARR